MEKHGIRRLARTPRHVGHHTHAALDLYDVAGPRQVDEKGLALKFEVTAAIELRFLGPVRGINNAGQAVGRVPKEPSTGIGSPLLGATCQPTWEVEQAGNVVVRLTNEGVRLWCGPARQVNPACSGRWPLSEEVALPELVRLM